MARKSKSSNLSKTSFQKGHTSGIDMFAHMREIKKKQVLTGISERDRGKSKPATQRVVIDKDTDTGNIGFSRRGFGR